RQPRNLAARSGEIGFVLPNSAQPGRSGDGAPRIACPAEIGFVLPNALEPCGAPHGSPRVARPSLGPGLALQGVERLDGGVSPRQRAALVAVESQQARRD